MLKWRPFVGLINMVHQLKMLRSSDVAEAEGTGEGYEIKVKRKRPLVTENVT